MGLHLTQAAGNDLRLLAGDCVDRLERHRSRGQLEMLKLQVEAALARLDQRDAGRGQEPRRSKGELAWKERR